MYVLRCIANPVASIQYYYGLQSLNYIDDILIVQPILPAKIHRPYLHKGGRVSNRAQYILDHYRFVQSLPERYLPFFLPKKIRLWLSLLERTERILKFIVLPAVLIVREN